MKNSISQFVALRARLQAEHAAAYKRLQEIEAALGALSGGAAPAARAASPAPRGPGRPTANSAGLTMREAISASIKDGPKRIAEIVNAMNALGYGFTSKNPKNSVGAFLYGPGKKFFKAKDGLFSNR